MNRLRTRCAGRCVAVGVMLLAHRGFREGRAHALKVNDGPTVFRRHLPSCRVQSHEMRCASTEKVST